MTAVKAVGGQNAEHGVFRIATGSFRNRFVASANCAAAERDLNVFQCDISDRKVRQASDGAADMSAASGSNISNAHVFQGTDARPCSAGECPAAIAEPNENG